jgi:subtilase family serine protease
MSFSCRGGLLATGFLLLGGGVPLGAHAANAPPTPAFAPDTARITEAVDNTRLVTVPGSRSLRALTAADAGALPDSKPIRNMSLVLKRSADKQSRYDAYVNQLNNPASPNYHKWLTAKQVGGMFGPAQSDIDQVTKWLGSQGLTVNRVYPTGTMISISGTPSAVNRAFHTQMHSFKSNGESHFANVTDQQIPAALAPVVSGVASLDNFFPKPQYRNVGVVSKDKQSGKWKQVSTSPGFTVPPGTVDTQTAYDVVPADFNKIYNVQPLWAQSTPIRGAGQTVAVLERTDVQPADIATFRSAFLPADAQGVVSYVNPPAEHATPGAVNVGAIASDPTCNDPGLNGDETEAA